MVDPEGILAPVELGDEDEETVVGGVQVAGELGDLGFEGGGGLGGGGHGGVRS